MPPTTSNSADSPMPQWERRVRTPSYSTFSLLTAPVSWAKKQDVVALLSNSSGRVEVHVATLADGTTTQVTDREEGTTGLRMSPNADDVYWFDDTRGSELGRWVRRSLADGDEHTILAGSTPAYAFGGMKVLDDGTVVVGRVTEGGFELGVEGPEGSQHIAYRSDEVAALADVSDDGQLALLQVTDDSDWLHPGSAVVRIDTGEVIARRSPTGQTHDPVGFRPGDSGQVLITVETGGYASPAIWHTGVDRVETIETGLDGEVTGTWFPDGRTLALTELHNARHRLHRLTLSDGVVTTFADDLGVIHAWSARADGSVHALVSRSDRAPSLVAVDAGGVRELLAPPATPPAAVRATDVTVDGPGGPVHALVYLPPDRPAPYATVFAVHGGPTGQDVDSWSDQVAAFVDQGYAVVRVNYRGSTGYGASWREALHRRLGFIELEDITAVRDALEADGVVDPTRVSVAGGSWGGYLTLMALGLQPERWRSGVALVPLADWATSVEDEPPFMLEYDEALFGGSIRDLPDEYRASSPLTYADDVVAPVFITAGENDPRCPVRQVDVYVEALRARNHDVHYDRLDGGHSMPDVGVKVAEMRAFLSFLDRTNPAR